MRRIARRHTFASVPAPRQGARFRRAPEAAYSPHSLDVVEADPGVASLSVACPAGDFRSAAWVSARRPVRALDQGSDDCLVNPFGLCATRRTHHDHLGARSQTRTVVPGRFEMTTISLRDTVTTAAAGREFWRGVLAAGGVTAMPDPPPPPSPPAGSRMSSRALCHEARETEQAIVPVLSIPQGFNEKEPRRPSADLRAVALPQMPAGAAEDCGKPKFAGATVSGREATPERVRAMRVRGKRSGPPPRAAEPRGRWCVMIDGLTKTAGRIRR